MATFDQLPADQRAIIELVLKRGRSYEQLADLLQMPESRVRELARLALADLSPVTAKRVDNEWRDQVADYALGQQSGPESAATRGHLRRSEAARVWLGSVVDSLEQFYTPENLPELPEPDGERPRARERRPRDAEPAARAAKSGAAAAKTADKPAAKKSEPLSGSARDAVQRRRFIIGGGAFVVIIVIIVIVALSSGGSSGNKDKTTASKSPDTTQATTPASGAKLIGQLALKPVNPKDTKDVGIAQFASDGKSIQIGVQAKLPVSADKHAYEVWLYNSQKDAVSLGAQRVGANGTFSGANTLPAGYEKYKYIDVSVEPINSDKSHSGDSILRGALADIVTPQEQQQAQGGGTGTSTTPGTGTSTTP